MKTYGLAGFRSLQDHDSLTSTLAEVGFTSSESWRDGLLDSAQDQTESLDWHCMS